MKGDRKVTSRYVNLWSRKEDKRKVSNIENYWRSKHVGQIKDIVDPGTSSSAAKIPL